MNKKTTPLFSTAIAFFLLFWFHEPLLISAGEFLAPRGDGEADVAIVEGTETVRAKKIKAALDLFRTKKVRRIVVILQENPDPEGLYALEDYSEWVKEKLTRGGVGEKYLGILKVPSKHPITLHEANFVLTKLSTEGAKRVVLLSDAFHTRRSYWTYRQVGSSLGLEVIPHPVFIFYHEKNWWREARGLREFSSELVKYLYYLFRGFVPLKSLVMA
jgi:hypothetical protein